MNPPGPSSNNAVLGDACPTAMGSFHEKHGLWKNPCYGSLHHVSPSFRSYIVMMIFFTALRHYSHFCLLDSCPPQHQENWTTEALPKWLAISSSFIWFLMSLINRSSYSKITRTHLSGQMMLPHHSVICLKLSLASTCCPLQLYTTSSSRPADAAATNCLFLSAASFAKCALSFPFPRVFLFFSPARLTITIRFLYALSPLLTVLKGSEGGWGWVGTEEMSSPTTIILSFSHQTPPCALLIQECFIRTSALEKGRSERPCVFDLEQIMGVRKGLTLLDKTSRSSNLYSNCSYK